MINSIEFTENIYIFITYSFYILYVLVYLGVWNSAPYYLDDLNYYMKIFVGTVLTITFNPFIRFRPSYIHRNISFSAGLLLLTSTTLGGFQKRISNTVKRVKDEILQE